MVLLWLEDALGVPGPSLGVERGTHNSESFEEDPTVVCQMSSSSLTTSDIDGRSAVRALQHRSASAANFSTEPTGYGPIFLSTTEATRPASHDAAT